MREFEGLGTGDNPTGLKVVGDAAVRRCGGGAVVRWCGGVAGYVMISC